MAPVEVEVEVLQRRSDKHEPGQHEDIHSDIANIRLIRDWEANHENSLADTVVTFSDFQDGEIYSI